jgi:hypothetical protein
MSDKLENFIRNNREKFDTQSPADNVWNNIQTGLSQQAAAGGAASAGAGNTAATAGVTKVAAIWKIAAIVAITAIVGTSIFFATRKGDTDGNLPEPMSTVTPPTTPAITTNQVEYAMYGKDLVNPPMPSADIPYYTFEVDAAKGGDWKAPTGTQIKVPGGIFVDAQGSPVSGPVQVKYREFHDAEDVLLSGITMVYDEKGTKENFQTAGMIDIQGSQGESPVFIAPGKEINVKMASFTEGNDYNLYYLEPQKGWKDIGMAKIEPNKDVANAMKPDSARTQALSKPLPPVKAVDGADMENEVMFMASYDKFPELRPFKNIRWIAADPAYLEKNENQLTKTWTDVNLEQIDKEQMLYRIELTNKRKQKFTINVRPALTGQEFEQAMTEFKAKQDEYKKMLADRKAMEKVESIQAAIYRTFQISGFGIYNCDRYYGMRDIVVLTGLNFDFGKYTSSMQGAKSIFHITGNNRSVLQWSLASKMLEYSPRDRNYLVMLLPDNQIAVFSPEDFKKLNIGENGVRNGITLKFTAKDATIHNAADLRKVLGV